MKAFVTCIFGTGSVKVLRVVSLGYLQVGHSEQRQQGEGHQVEQSRLSSTMDPGGHGGSQQT